MRAAIDVGTNTVRLLIGDASDGRIRPDRYFRRITRLGGGMTAGGLAADAMERTLCALRDFAGVLAERGIEQVRGVGTEVLRRADNGREFVAHIAAETGIALEIIDGEAEARLTAAGVLSALVPSPESCLIVDIGGGSTEFFLLNGGRSLLQRSYSLGVVRLAEDYGDKASRLACIDRNLTAFRADLEMSDLFRRAACADCQLVGTAGTITTLAALSLGMTDYDGQRVNNLRLEREYLEEMLTRLEGLSVAEREALPGMEKGRGDLIVPGLYILISLMDMISRQRITVSDYGLLEGVLLDFPSQVAP
ncbi:MAG: Ppx/GppA phosphatase family protein [Desulfuromonadales bacterium]